MGRSKEGGCRRTTIDGKPETAAHPETGLSLSKESKSPTGGSGIDGKKQSLTTRPKRINAKRDITPATTATSSYSFNFSFALFSSTASVENSPTVSQRKGVGKEGQALTETGMGVVGGVFNFDHHVGRKISDGPDLVGNGDPASGLVGEGLPVPRLESVLLDSLQDREVLLKLRIMACARRPKWKTHGSARERPGWQTVRDLTFLSAKMKPRVEPLAGQRTPDKVWGAQHSRARRSRTDSDLGLGFGLVSKRDLVRLANDKRAGRVNGGNERSVPRSADGIGSGRPCQRTMDKVLGAGV